MKKSFSLPVFFLRPFSRNEYFEVDFAVSISAFGFEADQVDGLTNNLNENVGFDRFELDKHHWRHVVRLTQEWEIIFFDDARIAGHVGREVFDGAHVVFVGYVLAFTFNENILSICVVEFWYEFVNPIQLDGDAWLNIFVSVIVFRTMFDQSSDARGVEYAGFGFSCHWPIRSLALGNIRFVKVRIWLHVIYRFHEGLDSISLDAGSQIRFHRLDVGIGRGHVTGVVGEESFLRLHHWLISHARKRRQYGVFPRQNWRFFIGECLQEDGEKGDKEAGQSGVVDDVEKADFGPRRRRPSHDFAPLRIVEKRAKTGIFRRCRLRFRHNYEEMTTIKETKRSQR